MKFLRKLLDQTYNEVFVAEPTQEQQDALVKEIHAEIDGLEQHYINEVTDLLNSIQIPTTNQVTKKADLMQSLGFAQSNETVAKGTKIKEEIKVAEVKAKTSKERLNLINKYRLAYPADKIIPMEEFEKVLKKYNLIYAPSSAYIKDVPEKNLLEMKNAKQTIKSHSAVGKHVVSDISLNWNAHERYKHMDFSGIICTPYKEMAAGYKIRHRETGEEVWLSEKDYQDYSIKYTYPESEYEHIRSYGSKYSTPRSYDKPKQVALAMSQRTNVSEQIWVRMIQGVVTNEVNREKLFIAAPKSHFDLSNLANDGKEYYETQKVSVTVNKDPIGFYLLRGTEDDINNEFVRIVSKWGTSDDQSYLDPIVSDERNN